ncbi:MAG: hypothetical protein OXG81_17200 [Acidobacteria bacterium]|nr:hypothetical protein [Acidobacteriota bacterium]
MRGDCTFGWRGCEQYGREANPHSREPFTCGVRWQLAEHAVVSRRSRGTDRGRPDAGYSDGSAPFVA